MQYTLKAQNPNYLPTQNTPDCQQAISNVWNTQPLTSKYRAVYLPFHPVSLLYFLSVMFFVDHRFLLC